MHREREATPRLTRPRSAAVGDRRAAKQAASCFPGPARLLPLPAFARCAGFPSAALILNGFSFGRPPRAPGEIAVALASPVGERGVLSLERDFFATIVGGVLGRAAFARHGRVSSGEEGAFLFALDRLGGDWIAAGGPRFELRGVLGADAQADDYLGAEGRCRFDGWLDLGDGGGGLSLVVATPPRVEKRDVKHVVDLRAAASWPVELRAVLGRAALGRDEIAGMEPGDVLELDLCVRREGGVRSRGLFVLLRNGDVAVPCRWLDPGAVELLSMPTRRVTMAHERTGLTERVLVDPGGAADGLEVEVRAEVGRARVRLSELLALMPGELVRLDRDVGGDVTLFVGDRAVASGELVSHEGRLAVEIKETR